MINQVIFRSLVFLVGAILFCAAGPFSGFAQAQQGDVFTGSWILNGERDELPFDAGRSLFSFKLSGHVNLQQPIGGTHDFWSESIGFVDTKTGMLAGCVWRSLNGEKLFIILKSQRLMKDTLVSGFIEGGTGKFAGAAGTLSFKWSSLKFYRDATERTVSGQALDLKGTVALPAISSSDSVQ